MLLEEPSKEDLLVEIGELRQQIVVLRQEKADLELLIETNTQYSDVLADDLLHTLDSTKNILVAKIGILRQEISELHREISQSRNEKADLELLLETITQHADSVEDDLLEKVAITLRESERRFRLISETIPIPITVYRNADYTIIYANEPAGVLFGLPCEKLQEHAFLDFYAPQEQHLLLKAFAVNGHVNNIELKGKKSDGTPFYGALYVRPLHFNNESCLLCAIYDMTERKKVEDDIRILNEKLEERVKKRTEQLEDAHAQIVKLEKEATEIQMAGGFAHEMRNALVGAKLMLESVFEKDVSLCQKNAGILEELYDSIVSYLPENCREEVLEHLEHLEKHEEILDSMLTMVNTSLVSALNVTTLILQYSRIGRTTTGYEHVNLRHIIEKIIREHHTSFAQQGIMLRAQLEKSEPIIGYESHFYSIFNNIILNAYDELLEADVNRSRLIEVSLRQENHLRIITISDNARGIPEEHLPKIFAPFFSTKPTTGTGLGLSFVSKLVPLYKGTVEVNTKVNVGTTFTLTFPVSRKGEKK